MSEQDLVVFTIFNSPTEFPGLYVLRAFEIREGEPHPCKVCVTGKTLASLRKHIPLGLVCFERAPDDPPAVVEYWM